MGDFVQITFSELQPEQKDILIARLAEAGFEGFEESESGLDAFINEFSFDETVLNELAYKYQLHFSQSKIVATNWNQVWEANFQPVIVDDFVAIRADFHEPVKNVQQEIIITPKMSFGTGHHATTYMMLQQMQEIDFTGKTILDFGTGTGVLAILAEKLGAKLIIAMDNDDWSIENANENIKANNCANIQVRQSSSVISDKKYDVILANINKNVILENMPGLSSQLNSGGILLISGVLTEDETDMIHSASIHGLKAQKILSRNNWICIGFSL